jgi:hypothetical protein
MAEKQSRYANPLAHPSIYSDAGTCDFSVLRCSRGDCGADNCNGRLYHCSLCPPNKCAKEHPSRVKDHFKKVHWENRIHEFPGKLYLQIFASLKIYYSQLIMCKYLEKP